MISSYLMLKHNVNHDCLTFFYLKPLSTLVNVTAQEKSSKLTRRTKKEAYLGPY